jgi:hypothetical protein
MIFFSKGINELEINDFRHGGANIIGFSIVDYYNINSIKVLSEMLQSSEPLNKIPNIPVNIFHFLDYLK